jgi:hypothetical protein
MANVAPAPASKARRGNGAPFSKEALLFVNKKKQKNFDSCGIWQRRCHDPP